MSISVLSAAAGLHRSTSKMREQITEVREQGFNGFSFFFYETFFNKLQRTDGRLTRTPRNITDLKTLFD